MAAVLTAPTDLNVGEELEISGTGFQNSHAFTASFTFPAPGSPDVVVSGTTSGGAFSVAGITMNADGNVTISVNDGTTTKTATTRVWRSC